MNIIFICKHNVFRSRVAEFYFKKLNKNPKNRAISGGLIVGTDNNLGQKQAFKELNIKMLSKPKNISAELLKKQDIIVIVANDIPNKVFDNKNYVKKLIKWNIKDVTNNNIKEARKVVNLIKNRVLSLIQDLEKK
jgi:protein-tyrosine-phosphatase